MRQKRLQGGRRAWPDMFIAEPKQLAGREEPLHGLFLELKRDGVRLYKRDGDLVANEHIREQAKLHFELKQKGYWANFACGFDEAKEIIDWYLGEPAKEEVEF